MQSVSQSVSTTMFHVFPIYLINVSFRQSIKLPEHQYTFTVRVFKDGFPPYYKDDMKLQNLTKIYLQYTMVLQNVKYNLQ